jgi:hypothetical protein
MIDIFVFIFIQEDNELHMRNKSSNLHSVCCSNNSPSLGFCNKQLSLLVPVFRRKILTPSSERLNWCRWIVNWWQKENVSDIKFWGRITSNLHIKPKTFLHPHIKTYSNQAITFLRNVGTKTGILLCAETQKIITILLITLHLFLVTVNKSHI